MPLFQYKAVTSTGQVITDVLDAPNEQGVTSELFKKGYRPIAVKKQKGESKSMQAGGQSSAIPFMAPKIKMEEIILFTRQLVTLLRAGVPMLTALEALGDQSSKIFGAMVKKIIVDVSTGKSLSQALDQHPKVFSKLFVNSVKAGEMSGSLDDVLERMSELIRHDLETSKKVKAAMQYPIFVTCVMVLAFIVIMIKVVPNFSELFKGLGMALPLPTRILIAISQFMQKNVLYIASAGFVGFLGFRAYIKKPAGRFWWDNQKMKAPLIGNLILKSAMARFTHMFETLNRSGLPILQTLATVGGSVGNVVIEKSIQQVALGVEKGEGIAGSMKKHSLFPSMVVRMISIGEQSGSLDSMLSSISGHYDVEVDYAIKKLTAMIEPILTICIGAAVVVLALGIFLPMWSMVGAIK